MKKWTKERFLPVFLAFYMLMGFLPCLVLEAQAAGNPYPYWQTVDYGGKSYTTVRCTHYAWQRVYDTLGIALPGMGNAADWLKNAAACGYETGTEPRVNALVCWTDGLWGHVGFVTSVNGDSFTYDEGGSLDRRRQDTVNGIYTGHPYPDGYTSKPDGFIYLDGQSSQTTTAGSWEPTLNFGDDIYVYIGYACNDSSNLYLKNDGSDDAGYGKVTTALRNDLYSAKYIWHCIRKGDYYWVINEYDGRQLDLYCGKDEDCTAIGLWQTNGQTPQFWRFYSLPGLPASTFCMMPDAAASRSRVADIRNGSTAPGGELNLYSQNQTVAQRFSLCKLSSRGIQYVKPAKPSAPWSLSATPGSNGNMTVSWSSVPAINKFDKRSYEVVVDGITYTTQSTSINLPLSAGSHSVKVCAINTNYADYKSGYTSKTISVAGASKKGISVTVKASSASGGSVSGGGTYLEDDLITVMATPYFGYIFKEWQQNGSFVCNSPEFSFTTSMNQNLVAVFEKLPEDYVVSGWIPEPQ